MVSVRSVDSWMSAEVDTNQHQEHLRTTASEPLGRPTVHGLFGESLPCRPAEIWVPLPSAQNVQALHSVPASALHTRSDITVPARRAGVTQLAECLLPNQWVARREPGAQRSRVSRRERASD
jgi:hypothetical protein